MTTNKRNYMYFSVILSFTSFNDYGDSQEIFEMKLPLRKSQVHSAEFLMEKFFPKIVEKCSKLNRCVSELTKISTASDWDLFEKVTGVESLCSLGHSCKWYFGVGRNDLDEWEKLLMNKFGFGMTADMSYIDEYIKNITHKVEVEI